jgi:8-oxo-dGTP pyrophosphatase MutT (NUDIX family)
VTPVVVEPRDSATVMLVRDGATGLEVFMVRRNLNADFVGGAYVFPGGTVDPADREPEMEAWCDTTDADASARLGVDAGGLAAWVTAVRECFEETGVLLARHADGGPVRLDDPGEAERFAEHRDAVTRGERSLAEVCRAERLRLALDRIHYFAHWITPELSPRRYDTRFFVAAAPDGQAMAHAPGELIGQAWVRPEDALERHRRGEFDLILPTIRNLQAIGRYDRAADLFEAAASLTDIPTVMPRMVPDDDGFSLVLPGDDGDEVVARLPATWTGSR